MKKQRPPVTVFWFRRDLRLNDNAGLYHALKNQTNVLPVFIFDESLLKGLPRHDHRVRFIHETVTQLKAELQQKGSDLKVLHGEVLDCFAEMIRSEDVAAIYANHDYEPGAIKRDLTVKNFCTQNQIQFLTFKDQCIFEKKEIVTDQQKTYTVYTPYKKKWLASLSPFYLKTYPNELYEVNYLQVALPEKMPSLQDIGFTFDQEIDFPAPSVTKKVLVEYASKRDFPRYANGTSRLGIHLRFGTLSPRVLARKGLENSAVWLNELIWRDFFMQILFHYPHVEKQSFRPQYEKVAWRKNKSEFEKWCRGETGYPMVDAGMRELNQTGFMHNRVRMVAASFLTKHLLMHWSLGERYFAEKLLDYDMAANNGNWQWSAGTGCDAAPYFRIFNPTSQLQRFDPDLIYIKKWIPEYNTETYPKPMVDHTFARDRALEEFKKALK